MSNQTVTAELVIRARDEASATMKAVGQSTAAVTEPTKAAGISMMDLYASVRLAEQGFRAIKGAYDSVITPSIELAHKTRTLQNAIGATAEEAGKLIYAADQADVSFGTLSTGLKAAIRTMQGAKSEGIAPTIEGLGQLADKYNAIADPIARTTFLMHNFGRSGADLATLMLLGGDGIRKLGEEAVTTGAILNQQGVTSLHNLDDATKKLNTSILGLKVALAEEASPVLTNLIATYSDALTVQQRYNLVVAEGALRVDQKAKIQIADMFGLRAWGLEALKAAESEWAAVSSMDAHTHALELDTVATYEGVGAYGYMIDAEKNTDAAMKNLDQSNKDYADTLNKKVAAGLNNLNTLLNGPVGAANAAYYQQQKDNGRAIIEAKDKLKELIDKGYTPSSQAIMDQKKKIEDLNTVYDDNATAHEKATKRILFGYLEQNLAADGLTTDELKFLGKVGTAWGVLDTATGTMLSNMGGALKTAGTDADAFLRIMGGVLNLPHDQDFNINVHTNYSSYGSEPPGGVAPPPVGPPDQIPGHGGGFASGANFIVPPGFPNDSYPIRVQSGEHVKVTPAGGGGDATITALLTNLPGMIARAVRDGMQR